MSMHKHGLHCLADLCREALCVLSWSRLTIIEGPEAILWLCRAKDSSSKACDPQTSGAARV